MRSTGARIGIGAGIFVLVIEKLYFDGETGLLSRRDMIYGKTPVQHYYEDYRDIDGIKVPFVLRSEGPVRVITRLTEIKHNVPIEDTKFKSPPSN